MKALVLVKVIKEEGRFFLNEVRGLVEGCKIVGEYNESNGAVNFKWNMLDAVLWAGVNCEVIALMDMEYSVARNTSFRDAVLSENIFDSYEKAVEFKEEHGGYLCYGAYWYDPKTLETIVATLFSKTKESAEKRAIKSILFA